jgi:hypothetical protein
MNVFYCNGAVSVVVASSLIKTKFNKQYNILIIEMDKTKVIPGKFTSYPYDYYTVVDLIAKSSVWNKVFYVNVKNLFISFENLMWPLSKLPIRNVRVILKKNLALINVKTLLKSLSGKDRLIVSDNSILWRDVYNKKCDLSYIEHGAASYRSGVVKKNWKYLIKNIYAIVTTRNVNIQVDSIYLSDNKRSLKSVSFSKNKTGCSPHSFDLEKPIKKIFKDFLVNYKLGYPEAYAELTKIKKFSKYIYIYMPTAIVPDDEYSEYLGSQIVQIKSLEKDAIFLIKPHGNDCKRDYSKYFYDLGLRPVSINININRYIPIEIFLIYFANSIAFGSYSSTHLYSNWWLNKKTLFTEVKDSSVQGILVREYGPVYDDLQALK